MNTKKGHITSITFNILIALLISVLSSSVSAHSLVLENFKQCGTDHKLTTPKFISEQGILISPIKINGSNTVNFHGHKQNGYLLRYSSESYTQSKIVYSHYFSRRQNYLSLTPIYIVFRSLII